MKAFFASYAAFVVLDFLWLGFVVKEFNLRQLAALGRIENGEFRVLYPAAAVVYILMSLAVVLFVLPRFDETSALWYKFVLGATMGLIVYGVFDFTNLAILKDYPLPFIAADMAWGCFVFGAVTLIADKTHG